MRILPHDPVVVGFARTPFGKYASLLKDERVDDLLTFALKNAIEKSLIDPNHIKEVIIGCANQAGEDNRNLARMAILLLGLDDKIPGITLNRLCSSGLDAVMEGARRIITGEMDLVLVGGAESMTRAPFVMSKPAKAFSKDIPQIFDTALGFRFYNPKMSKRAPQESNGHTVERLCELYKIDRKAQDEFALLSHKKAFNAKQRGFFLNEIVPIKADFDEGIKDNIEIKDLQALKPVFKENGLLTAGNSSFLSDGACGLVLASHEYAKVHGLKSYARILGFLAKGADPKLMGLGPVFSTKPLLENLKLFIKDFELYEINEAFAGQVLAVARDLELDFEKLNINGGALSIGHPLGASGTRLVMTIISALRDKNKSLGLVSLCVGMGQGVSLVLEAL